MSSNLYNITMCILQCSRDLKELIVIFPNFTEPYKNLSNVKKANHIMDYSEILAIFIGCN